MEMISKAGWNKLNDEREFLYKVERPKIVQNVADAAAEGDRSENAEYIYGRKKMREIDKRLKYLGDRLDIVKITAPPKTTEYVYFMSVVEVENLDTEEVKIFQLVGADESNPSQGLISYLSPLGRALMNKEEDDIVEFDTPGGLRQYQILSISVSEEKKSEGF